VETEVKVILLLLQEQTKYLVQEAVAVAGAVLMEWAERTREMLVLLVQMAQQIMEVAVVADGHELLIVLQIISIMVDMVGVELW